MNSEDVSAAAGALAISLHKAADKRSDLAFVLDIPLKDWEYVVNLTICCATASRIRFFRRKKRESARLGVMRGFQRVFPEQNTTSDFGEALSAFNIGKRITYLVTHHRGHHLVPWVLWAAEKLERYVANDADLIILMQMLHSTVSSAGAELAAAVKQ